MLWRFRNVWDNVGAYQFIRLMVSMALLVAVPIFASRQGTISPTIMGPVAFMMMWIFRGLLTQRLVLTLQILRFSGLVLFGLFVAWAIFRPQIPAWAGSGFFVVFGFYIGAFFWTLSDPHVSAIILISKARPAS